MSKHLMYVAALALSVAVAACATKHEPRGLTGEYADRQRDADTTFQPARADLRELQSLAQQGNAVAQYHLGLRYGNNYEKVRMFRQAAVQGYAPAQYHLGLMYAWGLGVTRDLAEAQRWYARAAETYPAGPDREKAIQARDLVARQIASNQTAISQPAAVVPSAPVTVSPLPPPVTAAITPPAPVSVSPGPPRAEEISLVKAGGVYTLPVEINGVLTLKFVLDSGAAEVNLPADVVFTLLRSGTIKDTDFLPGKTYVLADGSELRSPRLIIRSLKIGRRQITNVPASVGALRSSLLLGQSLLEKLGTWGIDNQRMVLLIQSEPSSPRVAAVPSASVTLPLAAEGNVADQWYRRALQDYQERNYEAAVVNFKQFLRQVPREHSQAGSAQYMIGESLYAQKQYEAAFVAYDEVVWKHSPDPIVAAAMLKQGYALVALQDPRSARFFFQDVLKKYPNSAEAQQAAEMLRLLR